MVYQDELKRLFMKVGLYSDQTRWGNSEGMPSDSGMSLYAQMIVKKLNLRDFSILPAHETVKITEDNLEVYQGVIDELIAIFDKNNYDVPLYVAKALAGQGLRAG